VTGRFVDSTDGGAAVDPRRELWRTGSYEIVGDWLAPASRAVLDAVDRVTSRSLNGVRLLDVAAGTGTVAIEAARRGATVVGVDLTDELLDIARERARRAGVEVRFEVGDFDRLDEVLDDDVFDVATSSFGVIFAPEPTATLAGIADRLVEGGWLGVAGWEPGSALLVPPSMSELLAEPPAMPDMAAWTSDVATTCIGTPFEVVSSDEDDLVIPFASVAEGAEQFERWSGGWSRLLSTFDALGLGDDARARFRTHLASFATDTSDGVDVHAAFRVSVLRRYPALTAPH
jgi:SAM-dependent methyltransferase